MDSFDVDNIETKLATTTTKPNKRKRKIEIKKVEEQNKLCVTFSKRKQGLFNKVIELSMLCDMKAALIITSPSGKFYTCGYLTPDTVIQHFLVGADPFLSKQREKEEEEKVEIKANTIRVKHEEIQDQLKEEKKKLQVLKEEHDKSNSCFPSWWNLSIDDMSLECLEEFKVSLERLKLNLITTMEAKRFTSLKPTTTLPNNYSLLSECFRDQQENCDVAAPCPSFMVPTDFGHYY